MSERNPFRPSSSGSGGARIMDGALVTDARLSQLFDPIARLVDSAYPLTHNSHERRHGRDSAEYAHLTAYPAIIEPATYEDGTCR